VMFLRGLKNAILSQPREGRFEILPHLKQRVHFTYLNLVEDAYPSFLNNTGSMDIIFCRNVLMYLLRNVDRQ
jgi:chemotaxis protein methyltransferase CheR